MIVREASGVFASEPAIEKKWHSPPAKMMGDCGNAEVVEFSDGRSRCLGTVGGEESGDVHIEKTVPPMVARLAIGGTSW